MSLARPSERGQALVEFALVLPVFLLILFGIIDFGRAIYTYTTLADAARDGARVAIVNQIEDSPDCVTNKPIQNPLLPHWSIKRCAAASAIALGLTPADVTVSYAPPPGATFTCTPKVIVGCIASVTVAHSFSALTPVIGNIVGTISMSSTSEVPVERVFP